MQMDPKTSQEACYWRAKFIRHVQEVGQYTSQKTQDSLVCTIHQCEHHREFNMVLVLLKSNEFFDQPRDSCLSLGEKPQYCYNFNQSVLQHECPFERAVQSLKGIDKATVLMVAMYCLVNT